MVVMDSASSATQMSMHAQRMTALGRANEVRSHRACRKRQLRNGEIKLFDLLDDPECAGMTLEEALLALPTFGRSKLSVVLRRMAVVGSKTVGSLTPHQRTALMVGVQAASPGIWRRWL